MIERQLDSDVISQHSGRASKYYKQYIEEGSLHTSSPVLSPEDFNICNIRYDINSERDNLRDSVVLSREGLFGLRDLYLVLKADDIQMYQSLLDRPEKVFRSIDLEVGGQLRGRISYFMIPILKQLYRVYNKLDEENLTIRIPIPFDCLINNNWLFVMKHHRISIGIQLNENISNIWLECDAFKSKNNIISEDARKQFVEGYKQMVMGCQFTGDELIDGPLKFRLNFNHPVHSVFFCFKDDASPNPYPNPPTTDSILEDYDFDKVILMFNGRSVSEYTKQELVNRSLVKGYYHIPMVPPELMNNHIQDTYEYSTKCVDMSAVDNATLYIIKGDQLTSNQYCMIFAMNYEGVQYMNDMSGLLFSK